MPWELRLAHIMYVTEWSWPAIAATPRHVLEAYMLVAGVHSRRMKDQQAESMTSAEVSS